MLRMGYGEVVFIQSGGKLDTMWRGAWQRLATRHQGEMYCSRYKWSLQQDGAPSHTSRNTGSCSVRTFSSLRQTFCPPNSPDLNTVNLPSGVLFIRRSTVIKVSAQLTKWRQRLSKAWQKLPHGAVIANSSVLSPFYSRLMLFARWRHCFPKLMQINYGVMLRMKRPWFEWMNEWRKLVTRAAVEQVESEARVQNLVKICSIFLKL